MPTQAPECHLMPEMFGHAEEGPDKGRTRQGMPALLSPHLTLDCPDRADTLQTS